MRDPDLIGLRPAVAAVIEDRAKLATARALHPAPAPRLTGRAYCPGCGEPAPCPTRQATQETT